MPAAPVASPSPAPPSRGRKGEATAQRILDAAEAFFAERGYAGTTLREVAGRVGIRNPSLYNHFPGKASLYEAVLERAVAPVLEALTDFLQPGTAAHRDSNRVMIRVMAIVAERPALPRLLLQETLSGGERLTPVLRAAIAPAFARAHEMVEATPAAARWDPEHVPLLVLAMYHVVIGYFTIAPLYRELNDADLMSPAALAEQTRFLHRLVETLFPEETDPA